MATASENRWVEVSPSQFTHETEGLELVRKLLPDLTPFRSWSNFEFRDSRGRWHEVDLLVLGRRRLHLVELKYYSGTLRGDDHTWLRDGHRAEDSPLKLARRKAQYFASKLQDEFRLWVREQRMNSTPPSVRDVVPFVQESVFLHHPRFQCDLRPGSELGLYGIDGQESTSKLPGLSGLLLEPADPRQTIRERVLVQLMARIGLVQRHEREAGSWVIQDQPIDEGEGWQEWMASHRVSHRQRGRIRFQVLPPGASESERRRTAAIADHEFRTMSRLNHEAILKPSDLVDAELGVGLVYPFEEGWQRLDLWLAEQNGPLPIELQLSLVRQVGEALQYAHGNRVIHRGLTPHAVWVRPNPNGPGVRVQVRDWQTAGGLTAGQGSVETGVTALFDASLLSRGAESWLDGFAAPEGAMAIGADRVRVDVFALGALAFYLAAGRPAVTSGSALRTRLREQSGLDLAPELPEVSSALRSAVLSASRPAVSDRTADVTTFLAQLSEEERRETETEPDVDPLEASPGAVLEGRFRLERRLGSGSTAVGLLVSDESDRTAPDRVLKVAIDDAASRRLADEAEVLASLSSPRLVRLIEGPLAVGRRQALLLENAGDQTLAQAMSGRTRVSLDLLERWGTDLLEALVALDATGVDHRDIKPANLGVRENRGDRTKHLVLFDFSLSRAAAAAVQAGTPPYLDPFLGGPNRDRYDSAAERYAAAVVLFEMGTGQAPVYGDGLSHPAAISDEADVSAERFDATIATPMVEFFRCALARDATRRHDTAAQMLTAWQQAFHQTNTEAPEDAAERQAAAGASTRLVEAGLSARALSALEPLAVLTVGDLVAVDPVRLSRLPGVAEPTRKEVRHAATAWRTRLGNSVLPERRGVVRETQLPEPTDAAEVLLTVARAAKRGHNRLAFVKLVLGMTGHIDAFATQAQIGAHLPDPVTAARANQLGAELQDAWAADAASRSVLVELGDQVERRFGELGGVATVDELVAFVSNLTAVPGSDDAGNERRIAGLLRLVIDRQHAVVRGQTEGTDYALRRREGQPVLVAVAPTLLDAVDGLGRRADLLVREANDGEVGDQVVPPIRVNTALIEVLGDVDVPGGLREPIRLARLAAALSSRAAASSIGELHIRSLSDRSAVALSLGALAPGQQLSADELRDRVQARFPSRPRLPKRPQLDVIVDEAKLGLHFNNERRVYVMPAAARDTTGLESRAETTIATALPAISIHGVVGQRLADSLSRRSFLALGAPAFALDRLGEVLQQEFDATVLNVTELLLAALREQADAAPLPWSMIVDADAQAAGSRAAQGLQKLIMRALPSVDDAVDAALTSGGDNPVVLTDAAVLARYQAVARLTRWTDLTSARGRALWLVVPQLHANHGPLLDGRPLPLASPGQFVPIGRDWVDTHFVRLVSTHQEGTTA